MAAITQGNDGKKLMADEDLADDVEGADEERSEPEPKRGQPVANRGPSGKATPPTRGFFTIYKKGQGYWTRMGTAIGAAFLGIMIAFELYRQIPTFLHGTPKHDAHVATVVALVFLAIYAILAFWVTNKQVTVDFLVATDCEMKKVNWTTRAELIGSTKIVIVFMFLIAMYLFTCDLLFGGFFKLIGVLKTMF